MLTSDKVKNSLRRFLPSEEELEKQMLEIFQDVDMDELLYNNELLRVKPNVAVGDIVDGRVAIIRNDYVLVDFGHKTEGLVPYRESETFVNEDLDIGDETKFLVKNITKDGAVQLARSNVDLIIQQRKVLTEIEVGQKIVGRLIQRTKMGWLVDIGGLPATLPSNQEFLLYPPGQDPEVLIDSEIEADIESINDAYVTLTRQCYANEVRRIAKETYLEGLYVDAVVDGTVKNITAFGVFIQIGNGIIGLCHDSDKGTETLEIGQKIKSKIIKIDKKQNRISLGIRQVTEPTWNELVSKYNIDDRVVGEVGTIVPYGVFVEIEPGINGLIHVSDLSWSVHIKHPKEILTEGEKVEVVILGIDAEKKHLSLGLKQISADPWETIADRYLVGGSTLGKVTSKMNFGIFVELEKGVEGLAHHTVTSKDLHLGDEVNVTVLRIDTSRKKISLAFD